MTDRALLCGYSKGVIVKDGTNCLRPSPGRHPLGSGSGAALRFVRIIVDPGTLKKTFEFDRPASTIEAAAYLFGAGGVADAVVPVGPPPSRRFALSSHDVDVVMRLTPEVLRVFLSASQLTSRGDPYANLPAWLPGDLQEKIKAGRLPKGAMRFKNPDPDWGDIVVWTGNVAVEVYMKYPSDPAFYRNHAEDARMARLLHSVYTQFNRDMEFFVFERGMEPDLARSEIRRINNEVFKLIIEGSFSMLMAGSAISMVGNTMRKMGTTLANTADNSSRIKTTRIRPVGGKVNVGGGTETPNMTNLNPCNPVSGGPTRGIPNHVMGSMEEMEEIFEANSVDHMMSSKLRFNDVNWAQATRAAAAAMRRGGTVNMNVWCSSAQEIEELETAFRDAGFSNVSSTGSGPGVMLTAIR